MDERRTARVELAPCALDVRASYRLHNSQLPAGFEQDLAVDGAEFLDLDSVLEAVAVANHDLTVNGAIGIGQGQRQLDHASNLEFVREVETHSAFANIVCAPVTVGRDSVCAGHLHLHGDID